MSKNRDAMTAERWDYIKSMSHGTHRYAHVSCAARMIPDPAGAQLPWIPFVQRPGHTFNKGRNAAKRARRAQRGVSK